MRRLFAALVAVSSLLIALPVLAGQPAEKPAGAEIVNMRSYLRWWALDRAPAVAPDGKGVHNPKRDMADPMNQFPPPADWADPEFDDSDWARMTAAEIPRETNGYIRLGTMLLRCKFQATDPATVESLAVNLGYRGGVVVYLNGKEVLRQDLPDGKIELSTPGAPYPEDAAVDSNGRPYKKETPEISAKRWRALHGKIADVSALRKGVNVLAIELHRSDYSARDKSCSFVPGGWGSLTVRAEGKGIVPNTFRPAGVQVWNMDRNDRATCRDYGDPCEPLRPIRLVGARNAFFTGQVVVSSRTAISGLKAEAGALTGPGEIPASEVLVRAALAQPPIYGHPIWFERLTGKVPADVSIEKGGDGAVLPVCVTVHVPKDAKPGDYRGELNISASGLEPIAVPVELHVVDWTAPDPKEFRTFVGVYQSQTSPAMQYKVGEWSEESWKYIDRSLEMLGQIGGKAIHVPVVDRTQYGNDEGSVIWIRKEDGTFEHDYSRLERYVKLAKQHLGTPDYVVLYIWHAGGWSDRGTKQQNTVTVLDKKTGKREHMQVPEFATPESKAFWTPVLTHIKDFLAKEGCEKAMCLGTLSDSTGPKEVFTMFNEIVPDLAWHRGCHTVGGTKGPYYLFDKTARVVLHEHCYGMSLPLPYGENPLPAMHRLRGTPATAYYRLQNLDYQSLLVFRTMPERALEMGKQGIGRICLDFWEVMPKSNADYNTVFNRWPFSTCSQREPTCFRLAWAGPEGAEPTARFEALREGLQESEAVIVLSQAAANADKVGPELAGKCRKLLIERLWANWALINLRWQHYNFKTTHAKWQDLNRQLFELAGEAESKLGGK